MLSVLKTELPPD